ncbi:hypothetical protein VTG60DRAFT_3054 [Thermothelomyces hinnuleus]
MFYCGQLSEKIEDQRTRHPPPAIAMSSTHVPPTMKALTVDSPGQPLQLKTVPTPSVTPGSCVVKILAVEASSSILNIITGVAGYTIRPNFTPGGGTPSAASSPPAQMRPPSSPASLSCSRASSALATNLTRSRFSGALLRDSSPQSLKFMADNWAAGCMAEYARAPLENCYPLDEKRLCGSPAAGGLGYSVEDLLPLPTQLVALGGLRALDVKPGERVMVAPATGTFSYAAVQVAVAMGAKVVAVGRSRESLESVRQKFPPGSVHVVPLTGDVETDTASLKQFGPVDAYIDLSPPTAGSSTHVRSCFAALRKYGRACVMNIMGQDVAVPYALLTWNSLIIKGQFMYERQDARLLIKMVEAGVLKLGKQGGNEILGRFRLEEAEDAFALAASGARAGKFVAITP